MNRQELVNTILMGSVFVLVFSGWTTCVLLWVIQYMRLRKRLQKRIGFVDDATRKSDTLRLWRDECEAKRAAAKHSRESLAVQLERLRADAGWRRPAHVVILMLVAGAALACGAVVMLGYSPWLGVLASAAVALIFWTITMRRVRQQEARFERQFVEALGIAARALRAGHPLVGAFQSISEEIPNPVGGIFGEICQEQALGLDVRESIRRVADATRNTDMRFFATAVSIQMSTGGNLAEVMDSLSSVMRSRMRLHRKVRALTASSRQSKNVLLVAPLLLFLFLNVASPDYISAMYTNPIGRGMLVGTAISMLIGAWMMKKLAVLKY
jgi:tight adherence protein B